MSEQGAQPAEGQGAEQTDNPNAPYLADVPGELHPLVEEVLKRKDADFTKRFQQASEFRSQWEPYSKIDGLNQMDPEEVQGLVEFYNTMNDPQQFIAWYEGAGQKLKEEFGYSPSLDEDAWVKLGQENNWFDPDDNGTPPERDAFDPSNIQAMIQEALQQELAPVKQFMGSHQQEQIVGTIRQELDERLTGLAKEHGIVIRDENGKNTEQAEDILLIAQSFANDDSEDDPIGKAVEKYLRMTGKARGDLMDEKLQRQNGSTLGSGSADTQPERYAHDDPRIREAVLNRIRGQ